VVVFGWCGFFLCVVGCWVRFLVFLMLWCVFVVISVFIFNFGLWFFFVVFLFVFVGWGFVGVFGLFGVVVFLLFFGFCFFFCVFFFCFGVLGFLFRFLFGVMGLLVWLVVMFALLLVCGIRRMILVVGFYGLLIWFGGRFWFVFGCCWFVGWLVVWCVCIGWVEWFW